ncbi:hypothetical protein KUV26_20795 [Leisingera daeponensis]|uniref:Uncharacterized protein n=1 Tax=Leisingera daeponensis TaxID=405746 RepID=A0ABS7NLS0_9RHOB|nr:hypothetical protein [Leisingera daeponensis]MBY6141881.1 hypothetical protein [Leisingera daeponensis]
MSAFFSAMQRVKFGSAEGRRAARGRNGKTRFTVWARSGLAAAQRCHHRPGRLPSDVCFCSVSYIGYGGAMSDFKSQIARHRDKLNELHERIHSTFKERDRSEAHKRTWEDACSDFHSFRSEINSFMDEVSSKRLSEDTQTRQFVFDFLSVDPIYSRSGYEKENLLRLLKPLELIDEEKEVLRQTILRRIRNGALREFRRFCQLIPKIKNEAFVSELRKEAKSTDAQIQRRAAFALEYVAEKPSSKN